jgi:hypothetical protein
LLSAVTPVTALRHRTAQTGQVKPKVCPVCGMDSIRPVERKTVALLDGGANPISGVLAYRCPNGHLFMVAEQGKAASQGD